VATNRLDGSKRPVGHGGGEFLVAHFGDLFNQDGDSDGCQLALDDAEEKNGLHVTELFVGECTP
jgi:hypothetical protein